MPSSPPRRLLLIDDDTMVRTTLSDMLKTFDYHVDVAAGGEGALALFQTDHYHAVITDLVMPYMNGLEVAEQIRHRDPDVPIILLTGSALAMDLHDARCARLRVLHKPVTLAALKTAVDAVCRSALPRA